MPTFFIENGSLTFNQRCGRAAGTHHYSMGKSSMQEKKRIISKYFH